MSPPCKPVVDHAVLREFQAVSGRSRTNLLNALEELAADPFRSGDYLEADSTGRPLKVNRFQRWVLTWWADHGACEVRVVEARLLPAQ